MVVAMATFALEDSVIKLVSSVLPVGQILFLLGVGGALAFESIISFPSEISLVNELKNIGFSHVKTIDFISGANSIYILQKK